VKTADFEKETASEDEQNAESAPAEEAKPA